MHSTENKAVYSTDALHKNALARIPFFQPKLTINTPGDTYEQEADRMADHVMRMPANPLSFGEGRGEVFFKPAPVSISQMQRKCRECDDEEKLHRKENSSQPVEANSEVASYINSLSSKGSPLPESSRSFFEPRFGHDFSGVRVHNDADAVKSSQSVNALAYTMGNNIVFNQNQFSPESGVGKQLLAHELTHVVQQSSSNGIQRKPYLQSEGITDATTVGSVKEVKKVIINALADSNSQLYPYIKDKLAKLPDVLDKMSIESADVFGHKYKGLNKITDPNIKDTDVVKTVQGFTNPHTNEIFLYLRSNYCHAFHEAIHTLSYAIPVKSNYGSDIMEGLTQYFTDIIFTEQTGGVCTTHSYKQQLACAEDFVKTVSFDTTAQVFFQGHFPLMQDVAGRLKLKDVKELNDYLTKRCKI